MRKIRAFTMLELITVLVILAVLALIAIPTFQRVVSQTRLEAAEVTIGSLARETLALKALDQQGFFTEESVLAATGDLPLQVAGATGVWAAGKWKVLLGATSFSTGNNILSVAIGGTPEGTDLGAAVYVDNTGCAYGHVTGEQVTTWSERDVPVELCSGKVALEGPDSGIQAPGAPGGLTLSMGACSNGEEGMIIDWEGAQLAEIFVNGESLGSFGPGTCHPGLTPRDIITVIESSSGGGGELPPGEGNETEEEEVSVGGVLSGDVIAIRWDDDIEETSTVTITRNGLPLTGPFEKGVFYDTPGIPGDYIYIVKVENKGTKVKTSYPSTATIIIPPVKDPTGAPTMAAANGNTIRVAWGAVPNTETAPLEGYRVYHARSSTATDWALLTDVPIPVENTFYDHAQLALGYHCYYVTAYGPGGESEKSETSCAKVEIVAAPSGMTLTAIASGPEHTCGISEGKAYCWGYAKDNRLGIEGIDRLSKQLHPVLVTTAGNGLEGKVVTDIAAGSSASCAIASGEVYCWGVGPFDINGVPVTKVNVDAVPVADQASFTSLSTSGVITCAVSNGKAYCWGNNISGRFGNGTNVASYGKATPVDATGVLAGKTVTSVVAGFSHTCAIASGEAYCWGPGDKGQRGDGTFVSRGFNPVKVVSVPGGFTNSNIVAISAGYQQTCAANSEGKVYCWGAAGRLGNTSVTSDTSVPVPVDISGVLKDRKVVSLTGGSPSSAYDACAVTEDGKAICWKNTPELITFSNPDANNSVNAISIGGSTYCATTGDGAYCWGSGTYGQVGNGGMGIYPAPIPVNPEQG